LKYILSLCIICLQLMYNFVFLIIILIIAFDFLLERILNYLNSKNRNPELPDELKDVYDPEQYRKQQEYKRTNDRFSFITSSFSFSVILMMLFLEGFSLVDSWAREITQHPVLMVLVFFTILAIATDIINTPFSLYDIFVIE